MATREPRRRRRLRWLGVLAGLAVVAAGAGYVAFYLAFLRDLPDLRKLADYDPPQTTVVYDRDGRPIGEFYDQRRRLVPFDAIPRHVVLAFVAGEDDSFFHHSGLDYRSILRAAWVDLTSGHIVQGASTITQQTVKSLLLSPKRDFTRKIKEMILARRLERRFSKDEILWLYLNQIYFGDGAWGIGEAARTYFGKDVSQLTVGEGALLAGLPAAPSRYSPTDHPKAAERRRRYVLGRMRSLGFIDPATYEHALKNPPQITGFQENPDFKAARWFTEEVRRRLVDLLGSKELLEGGLRIETSLDLDLQRTAVHAVREGLVALDHREGWRGPVRHVDAKAIPDEIEKVGRSNGLVPPAAGTAPDAAQAASSDEDSNAGKPGPASNDASHALLGVVTKVRHDVAEVALAPGVRGEVHLTDVRWARPRDPSTWPNPVQNISDVFHVGDVDRFQDASSDVGAPASTKAGTQTAPRRLLLYQRPKVEGAELSIDVNNGDVLALVGGYDFDRSQFDRAIQARRQPGSSFKPFVYGTALDEGYTPVTTLYDRPLVYNDPDTGFEWRPENYERHFLGPIPMREALARSINNATLHLLKDVGVDAVVRYARRLGIRSPLAHNLSLGLGTSSVSLLEMTRAYAVFASQGLRVVPVFIHRVVAPDGRVLLRNVPLDPEDAAPAGSEPPSDAAQAGASPPEAPAAKNGSAAETAAAPPEAGTRILPADEAYLMTDLLRGVIEDPHGTGGRARTLDRPLGGKTGTTNDQGDAWFVGFSPDVVTGVWVGYDERQTLGRGETGARAALPIWINVMRQALAERPPRDFSVPDGIVFARIDRTTGKLANAGSSDAYFQPFRAGNEPTKTASGPPPDKSESRRLRRLDF